MSTYLQKVNMRFDYGETFRAPRGTGYEVLLYNVLRGDATLFSRADLVESAWRSLQGLLALFLPRKTCHLSLRRIDCKLRTARSTGLSRKVRRHRRSDPL